MRHSTAFITPLSLSLLIAIVDDRAAFAQPIKDSEWVRVSEDDRCFGRASLTLFEVALFLFGQRPSVTVAWGIAPGRLINKVILAEGHIHN